MSLCMRAVVAAILGVGLLPSGSWAQQSNGRSPFNSPLQIYNYGESTPYGTPYGSPQPYGGVNKMPDIDASGQQDNRLPSDRFLDTMRPGGRRY